MGVGSACWPSVRSTCGAPSSTAGARWFTPPPAPSSTARARFSRSSIEWLDTEALERRHNIGRGSLIILDAIVPNLTASDRYRLLSEEALRLNWPILNIGQRPEENRGYLLHQTALSDASPAGKLALTRWWNQMQCLNTAWGAEFYEGLVAKRADSLYPIQLRNPESGCPFWIKHRWA
jgi:hypothetical protein